MIGAVIVAFNPNVVEFANVVRSVVGQVDYIAVVNNGTNSIGHATFSDKKIDVIENNQNLGIATAINIGLKQLIAKNCTHFLLLDHDSVLPPNMVSTLLQNLNDLNSNVSNPIAAVGPAYYNTRLNKFAPFIRFGNFRNKKIAIPLQPTLIDVDFLISSGTLLTLDALQKVGLMDEGLFIDFVDTEWCIRAKLKGFKLYGYSGVTMQHSLGDEPTNLCGFTFPMHSPIRHYYIVRNAILLMKKKTYPLNVKLIIFSLFIRTFVFYSLVPKNRVTQFKKMLFGIKDGLKGVTGKIKHD
jgi:rhamnosyltransferase